KKETAPKGLKWYDLHVDHLTGGHSGMEIGLGRGNANQIIARFLWEITQKYDLALASMDGGNLANAIPRECHAIVGVTADNAEDFERSVVAFRDMLYAEYLLSEGNSFIFAALPVSEPENVIDGVTAKNLIAALFACPNGVQGMSRAVEGLIETSDNLASVKMKEGDIIEITVHQRSSIDSRRDEIADRVKALFTMIGAEVSFDDAYVGWAPNQNSRVLKVAEQSFEDLFGYKPRVEALHAGLECGLFLEKMPDLDMISFGPTLKDIHSPGEKANIPSVAQFWKFLCDILRRLA
ncbi:MAG: M20/M25/M40 family metallo-hydrolase, partial [Muribaculaceae bacterium]|nr:M20/M25/M40 family metallo-hydrolase [Muribaculaceae bacterium]